MSEVVLVRPGCTDFDEQQRIQGTLNLPLNGRGQEQVDEMVDQLRDASISAVYTSHAEPALSTAVAISDELGIPVREHDELRNIDQGLWQGLPIDDVRKKYPKVFKQWRESPESVRPPEGETVSEAMTRLRKVLNKALKKKRTIAIVASEPLATLIGCYLNGGKLILTDSLCNEGPQVEYLTDVENPGKNGSPKGESAEADNNKQEDSK